MDFSFTEEQKMLRTTVRDFANKELEPIAAKIDETMDFPWESVRKMAELGLPGVPFPEEYGGSGGGPIEFTIVVEEISRVCAASALTYICVGLAGKPLFKFSNEEQRQRLVVPVAKGEKLICFALTESGAGSDATAIQSTATRQKDGYAINGTKIFITNGGVADIAVVFATLDKSLRHKGITAFVVEKGMAGFSVGKWEHKLGVRASSTAELIFQDCFIPEANRLGKEGEGFNIAMFGIDSSRVSVAAQALGIAQGAFDKALAYAKERQQFGQPIINFQAIQWTLADMATQIEAARLLTYQAAYLDQNHLPFVKESCMAKVFAPQVALFVTNKAIQIYGGYGYVKDYPLERYFRDARICSIYEGTDEMQQMTIARHLMRQG